MSFTLEKIDQKKSKQEQYVNIVVHDAIFDPMVPPNITRFWILMTMFNSPNDVDFLVIDLEEDNDLEGLEKLIKRFSKAHKGKRVFVSSILKVPPIQIEGFYKGICLFCVAKSMLENNIQFAIMFRDVEKKDEEVQAESGKSGGKKLFVVKHLMPNEMCGYSALVSDQLKDLF